MEKKFCHVIFVAITAIVLFYNFHGILFERHSLTQPKIYNILAIGDSLTEGLYNWPISKKFHPYTIKLQKLFMQTETKMAVKIINAGKSGDRVKDIKVRLKQHLETKNKSIGLVLILAGTNDYIYMIKRTSKDMIKNSFNKNVTATEIASNVIDLHVMCHIAGTRTGVITIPQIKLERHRNKAFYRYYRNYINMILKKFAISHHNMSLFIDLSLRMRMTRLNRTLIFADNIHFTPYGYDIMAEMIFEQIKGLVNP